MYVRLKVDIERYILQDTVGNIGQAAVVSRGVPEERHRMRVYTHDLGFSRQQWSRKQSLEGFKCCHPKGSCFWKAKG